MPLESATYISDLDPTNPVGSSDLVSSLDDHMRLVKATLKNTFPNIDGAVTATEDELNHLDGVTGTTGTGKLVLDDSPTIADLTVTDSITLPAASIADSALSDNVPLKNAPNTFSASTQTISASSSAILSLVHTGADPDEGRTDIKSQSGTFSIYAANDANNTFPPLLVATRNGVSWESLTLTASVIGINGPTRFTGSSVVFGRDDINGYVDVTRGSATAPGYVSFYTPDNQRRGYIGWSTGASSLQLVTEAAWGLSIESAGTLSLGAAGGVAIGSAVGVASTLSVTGALTAPVVATSTSTTLAAGQVHAVAGNATLPNMTAGQWVGVINNSASPITVTKNASDTMYWTASGASVTSVTVAARGKATFFCADGTNVYASGNITGAS